jgi:hypothetical protein
MKAEEVLIIRLDLRPACQTPNLSWGSMIDLADARVESPNATESRSQGNLIHWQSRLVD